MIVETILATAAGKPVQGSPAGQVEEITFSSGEFSLLEISIYRRERAVPVSSCSCTVLGGRGSYLVRVLPPIMERSAGAGYAVFPGQAGYGESTGQLASHVCIITGANRPGCDRRS